MDWRQKAALRKAQLLAKLGEKKPTPVVAAEKEQEV
jgi:hypothetical protein